ncbi:uncharacterized protein DNG_01116 [Cephalotrichum gorgonifer]|uniref:Uncharacterized protein n=1 Tax=Cephalotrichum gorgonifer TaxID=2041049 RepID=A0AAE8SRC7_9PEZI|nr:uncharacterized protein DNG_01116 [Cephalotrichum gorgonifer]
MRVSVISAVTVLALGAQGTLAGAISNPEPRELSVAEELEAEGFTIHQAQFTGDFGPNGESMTLNGTIQEVMAQAEKMQPGFTDKIHGLIADRHHGTAGRSDSRGPPVDNNRDDSWKTRLVGTKDCGLGDWTYENFILEGIDYLNVVPTGKSRLESYGCHRISCSDHSAIYQCWEPFQGAPDVYEKDWAYVADYAEGIVREWCPTKDNIGTNAYKIKGVRGKVWDPKGMAIHVRKDKC